MKQQSVTVNRSMVGLIGLVLLVAAGVLALNGTDGMQGLWAGACLKVGLVMGAFWLAMPSFTSNPDLGRTSLAALLGAIAVALILARTRIPLNVVLPVLGAFLFFAKILRPRPPSSRPRVRD
jgi:hypothetical protein